MGTCQTWRRNGFGTDRPPCTGLGLDSVHRPRIGQRAPASGWTACTGLGLDSDRAQALGLPPAADQLPG